MKKLFLALTLSLVSILLNAQFLGLNPFNDPYIDQLIKSMNYYDGPVPEAPSHQLNNSQQSQQNSYQQTTRNRNCYACNGSRQCQICKGTGKKEIASYTRKKEGMKPAYMRCDACGGSGKCQGCH